MIEENNTVEQEVIEEVFQPATSAEDKFFGVTTTIGKTPDERKQKSEETKSEIEVEILDDRPIDDRKPQRTQSKNDDDLESEIDGVDDQVKKRINRLKYEYHEERRAKEASHKIRDESVGYAQQVLAENKRLSALINKGEEALLGQISAKSTAELEKAKQEFKDAYESGDSDKMLDANEKILNSQVDLKSTNEKLNYYQQTNQVVQQPVQQPVQQQVQQNVSEQYAPPDAKAVSWLQENKWFGSKDHRDMTGYAYGLHETLIQDENIVPTSDEYYQEVDKRMHGKFPEFFGTKEQAESNGEVVTTTAISKKPSSVVAPAVRSNGSVPRKVQLTATQVNLARRLGITPEQYAKQVAKEMNNG
tara:strand:+ start:5136 stop:6218 length:1083 start_codon:yes stop_codon:yes gene_type:complete